MIDEDARKVLLDLTAATRDLVIEFKKMVYLQQVLVRAMVYATTGEKIDVD